MLFLGDEQGRLPEITEFVQGGMTELTYPCGCVLHVEGEIALEGEAGEVLWTDPCNVHLLKATGT